MWTSSLADPRLKTRSRCVRSVPAPLALTLNDYNATEKVSDLPRRLSTKEVPPGFDPSIGDIAYYAPRGNLAIFYKDFGYSSGLVKLGTIDSGLDRLNVPGSLKVTIEFVKENRSAGHVCERAGPERQANGWSRRDGASNVP
jgi:hypothetical protein